MIAKIKYKCRKIKARHKLLVRQQNHRRPGTILHVNYYLPKHKAGDYQFHACAEDETGEGTQC